MENADPNIVPKVQHVAKTSSDQLLRKFAEVDSDPNDTVLATRVKKRRVKKESIGSEAKSKSCGKSLGERKSLLPPAASRKPAAAAVFRRLGMSKAKIRAREIKNKSVFIALEKTWRRTIEGASRVLMENHYNRHKRLINDSINN